MSSLSEDEKRLYGELRDAMATVTGEESLESFTEGFRLGARVIFDVLMNDKSAFHSITE